MKTKSDQLKENISLNPFVSKYKSAIIIFTKIVIAAFLLIYIVNQVNLHDILVAVSKADILFLGLALFLSLFNVYLQYWKWEVVCKNILGESNKKKILLSLFYGLSAGSFTPARVGEYFGRAILFKDKPFLLVAVATLVDKFFFLIVIAFTGALASILFIHYYYHVTIFITAGLFILIFTLSYLIIYLALNPGIWKNTIFEKFYSSGKLAALIKNLSVIKKMDKNISYKLMFISLLFYLCVTFQYVLLAAAFSHQLNFVTYIWAGILVFFAKTIIPPVSIADLGIREGASVFFIKMLGGSASVGFNAAFFLFLINVLLPAVAGMFLLLKKNNA